VKLRQDLENWCGNLFPSPVATAMAYSSQSIYQRIVN